MFGLVAHLISSVTTILLPAYLSYKALRSRDPAQIHPWLIYFTILSLALLAESWTYFIVGWIPFYSWIRLVFLLYLVLPQTQGAKVLYLDYLEPYIVHHEAQIDQFISEAHARLQHLGLGYVSTLADYAQDLLSRFAMPQAQTGAPAASGIYGAVSGFAGAAIGGSAGGRSRDVTQEAAGIPNSLVQDISRDGGSSQDKSARITAERERLHGILKALENEQQSIDLAYGSGSLKSKSKSEQSFERIDGHGPVDTNAQTRSSSNQGNRSGNGGQASENTTASKGWSAARDITEAMTSHGSSTGVDRGW
ncbi:hypothetical protein DV736_g5851, partial [Chaetothyriales sp. CBS 134916]